jgi:hypothetical protein
MEFHLMSESEVRVVISFVPTLAELECVLWRESLEHT